MPISLISHPECDLHDTGKHHPECAGRLHAVRDAMISSGLEFAVRHYDAPLADRQQLERVHDRDYVSKIFREAPTTGTLRLDPDTLMMPATLNAALRAAGAGILGVDLLLSGTSRVSFCAVRPPGHHAERRRAMGCCIFNNIAVAAAHALENGVQRLAIVDFDVHHGNGTEDIFRDDERVLFCSSFQHPFYPYSGAGVESDHILSLPLEASTSGDQFRARVEAVWLPALQTFRPELVLISAGFDAHVEDDMAQLKLREPDYAWITDKLRAIADEHARGRILSMLEGGYALSALGRSVVAHIDALLGQPKG